MGKTWTTKEGKEIPYRKLENSHLLNILRFIRAKAEDGIIVEEARDTFDLDSIYFVEEEYSGEEVLEMLDYKGLEKEAKRRKLI